MPRRTQLSLEERAKIDAYRESGLSIREIARRVKRSKTTIQNYLADPKIYGSIKRSGRQPIVSERDKRSIKRLAVTNNFSCKQIKSEFNLNVTARWVNQILNKDLSVKKQKSIPKPKLTVRHKEAR